MRRSTRYGSSAASAVSFMLFVCLRALAQRRLVTRWIPILWVALACLSIAINGSRDLPQYFLQAAPALALAAGMAAAIGFPRLPAWGDGSSSCSLAAADWRVGADPFPKLAGNVWHDTQYALGRIDRRVPTWRGTARREVDKYSALDNRDLGEFLAARTLPDETVYVFGFSSGAYVYGNRRSASRFFWSRPGHRRIQRQRSGLRREWLAGIRATRARLSCCSQERDWPRTAELGAVLPRAIPADAWLRDNYHRLDPFLDGFEGWERHRRSTSLGTGR